MRRLDGELIAAVARLMREELAAPLARLEAMATTLRDLGDLARETARVARAAAEEASRATASTALTASELRDVRDLARESERIARGAEDVAREAGRTSSYTSETLGELRERVASAPRAGDLVGDLRARFDTAETQFAQAREALAELRGRQDVLMFREPKRGEPGLPGEPGPPGRDGTLEAPELAMEPTEDPRRFVLVLRVASGVEARAEVTFPVPIYQGVWEAGTEYQRGDMVTYDGGVFIALRAGAARPGTEASRDIWRLAVRRGRDGRDAGGRENAA